MLIRLLLAILMLLGTASARALDPDIFDTLAAFPASGHVFVVLDDAAAEHRRPAGASLEAALDDLGDFAGTAEAWGELAQALGLTPGRAFDELLGRRCVLLMTDIGEGGQWALLTEVQPHVEKRLIARLRPSPRQIKGGLPILAVENGRFDLVTSPNRIPHRNVAAGERISTILIAPASSRELFDQMLPLLRGEAAADPVGSRGWFAQARQIAPGEIVMLARHPRDADRFVALSARPSPRAADMGWDGSLRASSAFVSPWFDLAAATPWSPPSLSTLSPDVVLASIGSSDRLTAMLSSLSCASGALLPDLPDQPGSRSGIIVRHDPSPIALRDPLSCTLFRESPNILAQSQHMDEHFTRRILNVRSPDSHVATMFKGMPVESVRAFTIDDGGCRTAVSWCARPTAGGQGWTLAHAAPDLTAAARSAAWLRKVGDALAGAPSQESARVLTAGSVRPARLLDAVKTPRVFAAAADALSAARWVDQATWSVHLDDEGVVAGSFTIRMKRSGIPDRPMR